MCVLSNSAVPHEDAMQLSQTAPPSSLAPALGVNPPLAGDQDSPCPPNMDKSSFLF